MGSSRKESEKDREKSRKRKHKSRSRSRERDVSKAKKLAVKQENDQDREKERKKDKERSKKQVHDEEPYEERDTEQGRVKRERESGSRENQSGKSPSDEEQPLVNATSEGSLSIEETNKLRAKLGLRPLDLETDQSKNDGADSEAGASSKKVDVHVPAENLREKKATEELRRKLQERKEKRKIEARLAGIRGLGQDDEEEDAVSWVEKSRRLQQQKEEAEKRAKLLEQLDEEFGVGELVHTDYLKDKTSAYGTKHLKGLRVEHDEESIAEGREVILTLKDQDVLAADEDVLVNVNLKDDERYKKNVEAKKQKPGYQPYENEEFDEDGVPRQKTLLAKYDVEIDGEQKKSFVLGGNETNEQRKAKTGELLRAKLNQEQRRIESLESRPLQVASEYYTPQEMVSFKKVKKKVRKVRSKGSQMLKADDLLKGVDEEETLNELGSRTESKRRPQRDILSQVDDLPAPEEDLSQVKLEMDDTQPLVQEALKKAKKLRSKRIESTLDVEQIALSIKQEPGDEEMEDATGVRSSIVLNATAEFCRALGDIPTYGMAGNRDDDQDEIMDFERQLAEERRRTVAKEERRREVERRQERGGWNTVENDGQAHSDESMDTDQAEPGTSGTVILDEEPDVGAGVGAALKLAMSKGYIEKEEKKRTGISKSALELQAVNYTIEDKMAWEEDKYSRRSRYDGPTVEFKEKEGYKPGFKLDYIDDTGKAMSTKEAFRFLSHKFHGKGSGKQKTEKRSLKSQKATLMNRMSSTDTPLHTLSKLQDKQKELQSPYVVLSGKHASTSIAKPGKNKK